MPKFIYIMSYFLCELSIKIKVPLLSVVSACISVPMIINKIVSHSNIFSYL